MRRLLTSPVLFLLLLASGFAGEFHLTLRSQSSTEKVPSEKSPTDKTLQSTVEVAETWDAIETAVIICDVWDAHHSWNAVRRLEEFAPRMNEVVREARKRGALIIHAPSDCMPAYVGHPARTRAIEAPVASNLPPDIRFWCSRIPSEEAASYPVDQSDGGDDDSPEEHAPWAAKLTAMGRNPGLPWQKQSPLIEIDGDRDYISDRGDEVWNILEQQGIRHVILVGVHTNMCVLGRPFGLRQMAHNGKQVVLMRDMTDCMYNPRRWPHVDHFTGNDLVVRHVERYVCPTITSDQILGGAPFRSRYDTRPSRELPGLPARSPREDWTVIEVPQQSPPQQTHPGEGATWYRCVVRLPDAWVADEGITLQLPQEISSTQAWLNGVALTREGATHRLARNQIVLDDANLLVVKLSDPERNRIPSAPALKSGSNVLELRGRWEHRHGDDPTWTNIPLPAKFGGSTDTLFEPKREEHRFEPKQ